MTFSCIMLSSLDNEKSDHPFAEAAAVGLLLGGNVIVGAPMVIAGVPFGLSAIRK